MSLPDKFETELTKKLGIRYPIMCAGITMYEPLCFHACTNIPRDTSSARLKKRPWGNENFWYTTAQNTVSLQGHGYRYVGGVRVSW